MNRLDGAVVGVIAPGSKEVEKYSSTGTNLNQHIYDRFPKQSGDPNVTGWSISSTSWGDNSFMAEIVAGEIVGQVSEDSTKAMQFLDTSFSESWKANINKEVWVLKPSLTQRQFNRAIDASIDASNNVTDKTKFSTLTKDYFYPSGTYLEIYDNTDMLATSENGNAELGHVFDLTNDAESEEYGKLNTVNNHLSLCATATIERTITKEDGTKEKEIKNLVIVVAQVRVQELSADFVNKIDFSKITADKYVIPQVAANTSQGEDAWMDAAFRMEYPVQVLEEIQLGIEDRDERTGGNDYRFIFKDSPMAINLINGEMTYNGTVVNKDSDELDKLYRMVGDVSSFSVLENEETNASVFLTKAEKGIELVNLCGEGGSLTEATSVSKVIEPEAIDLNKIRQQGESWVYEYEGLEYYCTAPIETVPKTCTVILTDYLELTYMPGVIKDEPFIATGRRVKLTGPFKGTLSSGNETPVAIFTDRKGETTSLNGVLTTVNISNIVDSCTGTGYYKDVAVKLGVNGALNPKNVEKELAKTDVTRKTYLAEAFGSTIDTTNNSSVAADGMLGDFSLKHTAYYTWIRPVLKFGSTGDSDTPALAKNDADKELPVALYGLCVDTNMFDTGLYTNWITVTGDGGENGSVSWWNSWLKSHNFTYQVPMGELLSMIEDMYSVSIADKEDIIVLNLETINDINKLSEKKEEERLERTETTSFRVFGYILFLYGFLLPIAWVFDINMSNGPQFLSIITFGKYIALIDDGGMPMYNDAGKTYATLKTVIITTLSVWVVGAILILVPISRIFEWVTGFIKTLWDVFQKAIRGMR